MRAKIFSLVIIVVFSGCLSAEKHVEENTMEVIDAIAQNDIARFKHVMTAGKFETSVETNTANFNKANQYLNKYLKGRKPKFFIDHSTPVIEVTVPLFDGFDSSNGLRTAHLELLFVPVGKSSVNCELNSFDVRETVDASYREYLLKNNLIPNIADSINEAVILDSSLNEEAKKIPMFDN